MLNARDTARLTKQPDWVRDLVASLVDDVRHAQEDADAARAELATATTATGRDKTTPTYWSDRDDHPIPGDAVVTFQLTDRDSVEVEHNHNGTITVSTTGSTLLIAPKATNTVVIGVDQ